MSKKSRYIIAGGIGITFLLIVLCVALSVVVRQKNNEASVGMTDREEQMAGNAEGKDSGEEQDSPETDALPVLDAKGLRAYFQKKLAVNAEKTSYYVNIRKNPDADSEIIGALYVNELMPYIKKVGGFYEIKTKSGKGYVSAEFVLANDDAYNALKGSVGYAVMAKQNEIILYQDPDDSDPGIQLAWKGDAYRVFGVTDNFYKVSVVSTVYETLYVRKSDVILYYLFLGYGNKSGLTEEEETLLGELDIMDNLEKKETLLTEAAEEKAAREAYSLMESSYYEESRSLEESFKAQSKADEEAWLQYQKQVAAEQSSYQAALQKKREQGSGGSATPNIPAENPNVEGARLLGTFMITHYCHCQICCHAWGNNDPNYQAYGSSGLPLTSDYTVAVDTSVIPYGTRLLINGREYIAADSGVSGNCIDIYRKLHSDASAGGMYYANVYILP